MKHTTLLFLRRNNEILLAMKKRGFGKDKWNGVGGKIEEGESYEEAAIRECQEEIGVTPKTLHKVGELHFYDFPDVEHYCHIYVTTEWEGKPQETEEMRPQWFLEKDIPYDEMWPADKLWIPLTLKGHLFKGVVGIKNNTVTRQEIHPVTSL